LQKNIEQPLYEKIRQIFVATKSKISRSILKIIASWDKTDRTGIETLIELIQKSNLHTNIEGSLCNI
jgi:hypothetical protein